MAGGHQSCGQPSGEGFRAPDFKIVEGAIGTEEGNFHNLYFDRAHLNIFIFIEGLLFQLPY
jgi:hypothetical protein